MTLKKQSIRKNMHITSEGRNVPKDEIIQLSENWSEKQENFFRKMLKQGGQFKINGVPYKVALELRDDLDSNGNAPVNIPPGPGERSF